MATRAELEALAIAQALTIVRDLPDEFVEAATAAHLWIGLSPTPEPGRFGPVTDSTRPAPITQESAQGLLEALPADVRRRALYSIPIVDTGASLVPRFEDAVDFSEEVRAERESWVIRRARELAIFERQAHAQMEALSQAQDPSMWALLKDEP